WWLHRLPRAYVRVARYPVDAPFLLHGDLLVYKHAGDGRPHLANLATGEETFAQTSIVCQSR
ncbi:MAG: hypothetical protein M3478_00760, partial [Planctomycetota bacterium]|nr:hypothetical protein [Planctomycetota bacterium]